MADREGEQLTEEAMLLNRYLNQYRHCISVKKNLERRMMDIQFEFNHPLSAVKMSGMPHAGSVNTGCAALSYRLDEIETRINAQMEKGAKILADILDVIDFLPENSMERIVIEHKYIDRYSWNKICMLESITKTPAVRYWRKGLYKLLEFKKIQSIVEEYRKKVESGEFGTF